MRTRLDTPGHAPTWRIRVDTGSHRLLHLARLVLDAKGAAQQFSQPLSHVKRKSQPLRLAALAASGRRRPIAHPTCITAYAPCAGRTRPTNLDRAAIPEASEETRVIRPDAVAEGDQLAPIEAEEKPGAEDEGRGRIPGVAGIIDAPVEAEDKI